MDYTFYSEDLKVFIPIIAGLIGFIIFWFTQKSDKLKKKTIARLDQDKGSARFINSTRYLGGFTIGVIPLVAYFIAFPDTSLSDVGLTLYSITILETVLWIAGFSIVLIIMASFSARKPENLVNYPQIRAKEWNRKMIAGNMVSWAAYLLGYELFFRGILLFPLVATIGLWPAIAVNIGMYSATHIPKGLSETIGAIPLAVVLCLLSISTGTIWIAFFVHLAMAWTNFLTALKHNPEMKIIG
ncbi:MAG: CPBP family intramembrane metalloprotease [Prolixibacteraceae bacterium]|nr:CPBP family intramembrane metalloprotease [Prolixibacteraceae bacterium]MBN2773323.1 CPBP family intramembrane metalloprotease [Prolixibacteraceae bacterium]